MRLLIQRVKNASVRYSDVENKINEGLVVFIGIKNDDTKDDIEYLSNKLINLRIFEEDGKLSKSVKDINGSLLIVSQFTLYSDCKKGNRPSFSESMNFNDAKVLYDLFVEKMSEKIHVETGKFGEDMLVNINNNGPVTIILDS